MELHKNMQKKEKQFNFTCLHEGLSPSAMYSTSLKQCDNFQTGTLTSSQQTKIYMSFFLYNVLTSHTSLIAYQVSLRSVTLANGQGFMYYTNVKIGVIIGNM
jgi:hypothetical protein